MILRLRPDGVVEVLTHLGDLEGHTGVVHPGLTAALRAGALAGLLAGEPPVAQRPVPPPEILMGRRVVAPRRVPELRREDIIPDPGPDLDFDDEDLQVPEEPEESEFTQAAPPPAQPGKKQGPRTAQAIHALARSIRSNAGRRPTPTAARPIDNGVEIG